MKVRAVMALLRDDGWYEVARRGSHRQLKHPSKPGRVTLPGHPGDDLAPGTLNSILKQAGLRKQGGSMRYAVVIEKSETGYSAYVPDLPGCVATGRSIEETERALRDAVGFHIAGLRQDGLPLPLAASRVDYVEVAA